MVVSFKTQKAKIILTSVICVLCVVALVVTVMIVRSIPKKTATCDGVGEYSLVVESDEEIQAFINQFGYEAVELYSLQQAYVPIEFNQKYTEYNELQKMQGLDLEGYKGEKCRLYIYTLKEFKDEKKAYVSILVLDERVIGGHISTLSGDGNLYSFTGEKYE